MYKLNLAIKTAPTTEPLELATVKEHLRIDASNTTEDNFLLNLIKAARQFCETKQGRAYCLTTYTGTLDAVPFNQYFRGTNQDNIFIPIQPIKRINSIKIMQTDGTTATPVTIPPAQYDADLARGLIKLNKRFKSTIFWESKLPAFSCFAVDFTAGYDTANGTTPEPVPAKILQAILLIIGHWYEHREDATDGFEVRTIPTAADALLQQEKVY